MSVIKFRAFGAVALVLSVHVLDAHSPNAAGYLPQQEMTGDCPGISFAATLGGGQIARDLDGDGGDDPIMSHGGIRCGGSGRSLARSMSAWSVWIWLRRGDLLQAERGLSGGGVLAGEAPRTTICGYGHGGGNWAIRLQRGRRRTGLVSVA